MLPPFCIYTHPMLAGVEINDLFPFLSIKLLKSSTRKVLKFDREKKGILLNMD